MRKQLETFWTPYWTRKKRKSLPATATELRAMLDNNALEQATRELVESKLSHLERRREALR